jgi:Zn-dependent peptidase ImmA (M78 family)
VPVRLTDIANSLGLSVKAATLPAGISGEIRPDADHPGSYVIRVNRHDAKRRQRFTVAHEIAHFLLHRDAIGDGIMDDVLYRSNVSNAQEAQANRLAADILVPQSLLTQWLENARVLNISDAVTFLADRFEVSEASMRIKLGLD